MKNINEWRLIIPLLLFYIHVILVWYYTIWNDKIWLRYKFFILLTSFLREDLHRLGVFSSTKASWAKPISAISTWKYSVLILNELDFQIHGHYNLVPTHEAIIQIDLVNDFYQIRNQNNF